MSEGLGFTSDPKVVKLIVRSVIEHQRRVDNTYENVVMYGTEEAHGAPLNPGDKMVYFIRHGQSLSNAAPPDTPNLPEFIDAPLTKKGIQEAIHLRQIVPEWKIQLVLSSPMRRALQTSSYAFTTMSVPVIAWPNLTEFYPESYENQALPRDKVENDISRLPRSIIMDNLSNEWWSKELCTSMTRVPEFLAWLASSPISCLAVVCHWGVIRQLLNLLQYREALDIKNAIPISVRFEPTIVAPSFTDYKIKLSPASAHRQNKNNALLRQLEEFYDECRADQELQTATELGPPHVTLVEFWPLSPSQLDEVRNTVCEFCRQFQESDQPYRMKSDEVKVVVGELVALFVRIVFSAPFPTELATGSALQNGTVVEHSSLVALQRALQQLNCYTNTNVVRSSLHVSLLRDDKPEGKSLQLSNFSKILEAYPLVKDMFSDNGVEWKEHFSQILWDVVIQSKEGTEHMNFRLYKKV